MFTSSLKGKYEHRPDSHGFLYYNSIEDLKFLIKTSGINIKLFIRELNTISIYWLKKSKLRLAAKP